jgi:ATP/maltotriose-dependent transcriptional regulator MalT
VRDALQELERAGQSPALSDAERSAAQAWAGFARISLGDLDGAAALAEQARSAATSAGDHETTSIVMSTVARTSESRGHLREALEIAEKAVRLADESPGRLGHRFPVCVTRGRILIELDRPQEARSELSAGMRMCEELGVRWALATHQVYLAYGRFLAGEWDDATAELEACLKLAEETGEIYSLVYAHGLLARISLHRNDLSRAQEAAAAADRNLAGWGAGHSMTWVAWPRALILEAGGEPERALATMAALWDWCTGSGLALEYPALGPDLCPARAGGGRSEASQGDVSRRRRSGRRQRRGLDDRRGAALPGSGRGRRRDPASRR